MPTRSEFLNVQFAYIKSSDSGGVSEALADAVVLIDDARSPVLDARMTFHLALASSHSLRETDFLISFQALI